MLCSVQRRLVMKPCNKVLSVHQCRTRTCQTGALVAGMSASCVDQTRRVEAEASTPSGRSSRTDGNLRFKHSDCSPVSNTLRAVP